ncbi:MAG: hypothetical protein WCW52_04755 [Elusimicrobiales bacterium]|jgi:hypothetical protein
MRFLLFVVLILQQSAAVFAFTEVEKRRLVLDAKKRADSYIAAAVRYLDENYGLEAGMSSPIIRYTILQDRLKNPNWNFVLQSEADPVRANYCENGQRGSAYYDGTITVVCDRAFDSRDDSALVNYILHEEVHAAQAHDFGALSGDDECEATEMAGVTMLLSGNYMISNDYLLFGRCANVSRVLRTVQDDFKKHSVPLAAGQFLTVDKGLAMRDVRPFMGSYLPLISSEDDLVEQLRKAGRWRIGEISDEAGTASKIKNIVLQAQGSGLRYELLLSTYGLEIYADDFEKAFSRKVKITPSPS